MKRIVLSIIILFLLPSLVSAALNVEIDIKDSFTLGETLSFDYTIYSDSDQTVTFIPHITCPNAPIAFLEQRTVDLKSGESYTDTYSNILIDESTEPQTCTAYVKILSPVQMIEQKNFSIITNPSFPFELKTCKDQSCTEESKVFIKNTDIYLDYDSEVPDPSITATLILPDKATQQLTLPTPIKAIQTGTYNLEVIASKEGYKTITKKEQFAVIEKEAEIEFVGVCNANGKCEAGETPQNCPQDCKEKIITPTYVKLILVLAILIFVLIIIYFKVFLKKSRKR